MPEELPGLPLMVIFASLRRLLWGVPLRLLDIIRTEPDYFASFTAFLQLFCKFGLLARFTEPFGELFGNSAGVLVSVNRSVNRSVKRHGAPERGNKPRRVTPLPFPLLDCPGLSCVALIGA